MPTLVAFHAHPDDEAIFTGGVLLLARRAGWRTVVVFATTGELGGAGDPRDIAELRRREAARAAEILGVSAVEFLGFQDSGMAGESSNHHDASLATAPVEDVAERLAGVLQHHHASALTSYDQQGIYGHPDHLAVHRAARHAYAAGLVPALYEATVDRAWLEALRLELIGSGRLHEDSWPLRSLSSLGTTQRDAPWRLDVSAVIAPKKRAITAHASQVMGNHFMGIPAGAFDRLLTQEWLEHVGGPPHLGRVLGMAASR